MERSNLLLRWKQALVQRHLYLDSLMLARPHRSCERNGRQVPTLVTFETPRSQLSLPLKSAWTRYSVIPKPAICKDSLVFHSPTYQPVLHLEGTSDTSLPSLDWAVDTLTSNGGYEANVVKAKGDV